MLVMKFGGTSVQNATSMRSVIDIVTTHAVSESGTVVILSATSGTTTMLLDVARAAARKHDVEESLHELNVRHRSMLSELVPGSDSVHIDDLCAELGEYLRALSVLGECSNESDL